MFNNNNNNNFSFIIVTEVFINYLRIFNETFWYPDSVVCFRTCAFLSRAYMICNNKDFLKMELEHLKSTFTEINNFPPQVVAPRTLKQVVDEQICVPIVINEEETVVVEPVTTMQITLPYPTSSKKSRST